MNDVRPEDLDHDVDDRPVWWFRRHWKATALVVSIAIWLVFEVASFVVIYREANRVLVRSKQSVPAFTKTVEKQLTRFRNRFHLRTVEKSGVPTIEDGTIQELIETGQITKVTSDETLLVRKMMRPYLHPAALSELRTISRAFFRLQDELGLSKKRIVLTSASRTVEDQRKLRKRNGNAAQRSSHTSGLTFDLHYQVYGDEVFLTDYVLPHHRWIFRKLTTDRNDSDRKGLLAQVLLESQEAGRTYVIHERNQPVFHVTTRSLE